MNEVKGPFMYHAKIEQFTYAAEELRQFVIYTYYDKNEKPLYVGCSKDFYNAHYFNSKRLSYFGNIQYVGFVFLKDENNMNESKKYYIRAREPEHNRGKHRELPYLKGCDVFSDDLVVSRGDLEQLWEELLGSDNGIEYEMYADSKDDSEAEKETWINTVMRIVKIKDRDLTQAERRYAELWLNMGIDEYTAKKAYETTVIRTGKFSWPYMHCLLKRWKGE